MDPNKTTKFKKYKNRWLFNDIGLFKCSLSENESQNNEKRKHKITWHSLDNKRNGYILEETKVYGFDFLIEKGKSSWPKIPEKKTFLIGECGTEVELENEPLLFSDASNTYFNHLEQIRRGIVDQALSTLPKREATDETNMCSQMKNAQKKYSLNEAESAYFIFKWLSKNIEYECYAYTHGTINYSESYAYIEGKGVCNSYSLIFMTMCKALGLEYVLISGYSKGTSYFDGQMPTKTNHAWNAVKIDSQYYLIDSTWGAGTCSGDVFNKKFREFYFCTNPELFIRKHLPADNQWQLLSRIITIEEFVNMAKLSDGFFDGGFLTINPDTNILSIEGQAKIILTYETTTNITLTMHLYYIENSISTEINNKVFYSKSIGKAEINLLANKIGEYKLRLYGGPSNSKSYPHLIDYKITNTKALDDSIGFPKIYTYYSNSDMQIIEPLYNPLKKGTKINFKIKTSTYDKPLHMIIFMWEMMEKII